MGTPKIRSQVNLHLGQEIYEGVKRMCEEAGLAMSPTCGAAFREEVWNTGKFALYCQKPSREQTLLARITKLEQELRDLRDDLGG